MSRWLMTTEDGCAGGSALMEDYSSHYVPTVGGNCAMCNTFAEFLYGDGALCPACCPAPLCEICDKQITHGQRYFSVLEGPDTGLYCKACVKVKK